MPGIQPVNVSGAILVVQLCLIVIFFFGTAVNFENRARSNRVKLYGATILLAIFSILAVAMSADFYAIWAPILGDVTLPTIARSNAFAWVFTLDIVVTMVLVAWTGGTLESPFTAVLFLIPALAIFLRETPTKFFLYATLVGVYYYLSVGFDMRKRATYESLDPFTTYSRFGNTAVAAHRFVNLGCLALATVIGYITRPIAL
jgi:hypothetical protein